jgi:hypothetical protein
MEFIRALKVASDSLGIRSISAMTAGLTLLALVIVHGLHRRVPVSFSTGDLLVGNDVKLSLVGCEVLRGDPMRR